MLSCVFMLINWPHGALACEPQSCAQQIAARKQWRQRLACPSCFIGLYRATAFATPQERLRSPGIAAPHLSKPRLPCTISLAKCL